MFFQRHYIRTVSLSLTRCVQNCTGWGKTSFIVPNSGNYLPGLAHILQADKALGGAQRSSFQQKTRIGEKGCRTFIRRFAIALCDMSTRIAQMGNRRYRIRCRRVRNIAQDDFEHASKRRFLPRSLWVGPLNRILLQWRWPRGQNPTWITNTGEFESATKFLLLLNNSW